MSVAQPAPSRWLFGPAPDLLLGCGLLYALAIAVFALAGPEIRAHQASWVVPMLILLVSMPHYGGTLLRVYERRAERQSYVLFSVGATLVLAACFVAGVYDVAIASWLFTLYITWSPWHYTGQNYGIAVLFLRRRGVAIAPDTKRWLHASYVLSYALTFLTFHGSFGALVYSPDVSGNAVAFHSLGIPARATNTLFPAALVAYATALGVVAWRLLRIAPARDLLPTVLVTLTQALWFSVPFALRFWGIRSGIEPLDAQHLVRDYIFFVALGHAAQYLWITSYTARASPGWPGIGRYLGKTLVAGTAVWTLPAVLFAPDWIGRAEYNGGLSLLIAAVVNLHHFVLDGVIWKLRHYRIANLLLRAAPADAGVEPAFAGTRWVRRGVWALAAVGLSVAFCVFWVQWFAFGAARERGDLAQASALLDGVAWLGRDSSNLRLSLGNALERDGDKEGALGQYARAASLDRGYRAHLAAGRLLAGNRRFAEAALEFDAAQAAAPRSVPIATATADAWLRAGESKRARSVLEAALAESPGTAVLHESLGRISSRLGDDPDAVRHWREALHLDPKRVGAANDLAWLLATSADPRVRDPGESIRVAQSMLDASRGPDPNQLDTLAAALAAAGRFDEAVAVATRAADLARASEADTALQEAISRRLALYRSRRPYVAEPAPARG